MSTSIKTSTGKPPANLYGRCRDAFGVDWEKNIIITYGDTAYCRIKIPEDTLIHEEVHVRQQQNLGKDIWWEKFFADKKFRLSQELEAYQAQYDFVKKTMDKKHRKFIYDFIIKCITTMYGDMVSGEPEARKIFKY